MAWNLIEFWLCGEFLTFLWCLHLRRLRLRLLLRHLQGWFCKKYYTLLYVCLLASKTTG